TNDRPQQLIVCPHQDIHLVRSTLANNFGLTNEVLCFENGHGYEILNLSNNLADGIVTKIGHSMWDLSDRNHYQYALKFQQYYALKVKHEYCASYEEYFSLFNNLINSIK